MSRLNDTQELFFVASERGGAVLLHDGYIYHKKRNNKNGSAQWNCRFKYKCRGSMTVRDKTIISEVSHDEDCVRDHAGNEIKKEIAKWRDEATQGSKSIMQIYKEGVNRLKERGLASRVPELKSVKHGLYNARNRGLAERNNKSINDCSYEEVQYLYF